jgi:hypothetical protein
MDSSPHSTFSYQLGRHPGLLTFYFSLGLNNMNICEHFNDLVHHGTNIDSLRTKHGRYSIVPHAAATAPLKWLRRCHLPWLPDALSNRFQSVAMSYRSLFVFTIPFNSVTTFWRSDIFLHATHARCMEHIIRCTNRNTQTFNCNEAKIYWSVSPLKLRGDKLKSLMALL